MKVLVVNCGSSSIKYQLMDMPEGTVLARGVIGRIGEESSTLEYTHGGRRGQRECAVRDHDEGMALLLRTLADPEVGVIERIREIGGVGHRVVHGREYFTGSVLIDEEVIAAIERCADLAPLHNPPNLSGIRAAQQALPKVPQIACFDTAFHTTIPEVAYIYALPYELYEEYGIRRYGFHGISHRYVARRAAQLMGLGKYDINCITCHLGNGCSVTAVKGGRSVDTSMGMTPLEGVAMGTRSGNIDPAILFFLARKGYTFEELDTLLNKKSGLLGVSGKSNDMRALTALAGQGDKRAQLAIDLFCYRIKKYIGLYTTVMGTLDAIVFTGGIGQNSPYVRAGICDSLGSIGVILDHSRNQRLVGAEGFISTPMSPVKLLVTPTNEEGAIARDTYEIASGAGLDDAPAA